MHKNNLGDNGVKALMKAFKYTKSVIEINLASNEICNEGMLSIFEGLMKNESVISLNVATLDGIARNRVS